MLSPTLPMTLWQWSMNSQPALLLALEDLNGSNTILSKSLAKGRKSVSIMYQCCMYKRNLLITNTNCLVHEGQPPAVHTCPWYVPIRWASGLAASANP